MSWRAFFIGLLAVAAIAAAVPYNDFTLGNTYITGNHFPPGPFFILVGLTLGLNVLVKLVRKQWALRRSELMLVWCMMICAATVPSSGLMRLWFPIMVAPAEFADAADLPDQARVLQAIPDSLVLSKDTRSPVVENFYQGSRTDEKPRIYLSRWIGPMLHWLVFIGLFYLAIFFLGGMLRRQWVDVERLIFPLARVPLDMTEGSAEESLLPALFRHKDFLFGATLTLIFAFIRVAPTFWGGEGILTSFPLQPVLSGTPLENLGVYFARIYPLALGIAFLVPADVSLSIWFFFLFNHMELQVSHWIGNPITGGDYGDFMNWQQAGAFIIFTLMMLWAARRQLLRVVRTALPFTKGVEDSDEPVSYSVGFWGFLIAAGGMVAWFCYYKMNPLSAIVLIALIVCIALVHARVVCQGGIFFTQQGWWPPQVLHGVTGGMAFGHQTAAAVAVMQSAVLVQDAREILSAHAMNALRISEVFKKHKRLFVPVMLAAIGAALVVGTWSSLNMFYRTGGYNISNTFGTVALPKSTFKMAGRMITDPTASADPHMGPFALGAGIMFFVTVMRGHFYWWPLHSLGFLIGSTWPAQNLWFCFLLAWGIKVGVMKLAGGAVLRRARRFFIGVVVAEAFSIGVFTVIGLLTGLKTGFIFLPG